MLHFKKILKKIPKNAAIFLKIIQISQKKSLFSKELEPNATLQSTRSDTKLRMVRIGHPSRVMESVVNFSLDSYLNTANNDEGKIVVELRTEIKKILKKIEKMIGKYGPEVREERRNLRGELRTLEKDLKLKERTAVFDIIRHCDVVASTLTGISDYIFAGGGKGDINKKPLEFDLVIVDEAAQATEQATWIALLRGTRAILVGFGKKLSFCIFIFFLTYFFNFFWFFHANNSKVIHSN